MKRPLILAAAILLLGSLPAIHQHHRATQLSQTRDELRREASARGIAAPVTPETRRDGRRRETRDRPGTDGVAAEIAAIARAIDATRQNGEDAGEDLRWKSNEIMERLAASDPAEIRRILAALRGDASISDETRGNLVSFAALHLAEQDPKAALTLLLEDGGPSLHGNPGKQVISSALHCWAETDPDAALKWLRQQESTRPELVDDEARLAVVSGTAASDPALAFKLMAGIGLSDKDSAIHAVMMAGGDDESHRSAVLHALRDHLQTVADPVERDELSATAFELLARNTEGGDFDAVSSWVAEMNFSEQEKTRFAAGLDWFTTKQDTGKWIDWLTTNLPPDAVGDPVRELVGEWTQQDYLAAGQWLAQAPAGPAKEAAVESYAGAVAAYEPQVATQWALTLPQGPARDATLRAIRDNWPVNDPEGAAAFARQHGIE